MSIGDQPAFPVPSSSQDNMTGATMLHQAFPGMTVRQFIATQAMVGILSDLPDTHSRNPEWVAREANKYADAMIASWEPKS